MSSNYYDILIIGSGMAGLYSAYNIKKMSPSTSFVVLEKYKENWIGGRTSNETFYDTEIVTGAGVGRQDTNPLLIKLMKKLHIKYTTFNCNVMNYASTIHRVDLVKIMNILKKAYKKHPELHHKTFKQYFIKLLGSQLYHDFATSSGYSDFENADVAETLYNYGMEDNQGGWTVLNVPWREMVNKLYDAIGHNHFKFSQNVVKVTKIERSPCLFEVLTKDNTQYFCNKVIVATTIDGIKQLVPGASSARSLYQQIHGQTFLRLYAKFDKKSNEILKKYVPMYTIVPGPLQKIIPMSFENAVYMISYSDNENAKFLKDYLENTSKNRSFLSKLVQQSLGIPEKLEIIAIKDFYWPIGTHYYEPLKRSKNRNDFVYQVQHPERGMLVVGEAVSRYQGWTEGALESVEAALDKKWVTNLC